jgi:hypothetical protein
MSIGGPKTHVTLGMTCDPERSFHELRLTTVHENGLAGLNPFVFSKDTGYFHGSEGSAFLCDGEARC